MKKVKLILFVCLISILMPAYVMSQTRQWDIYEVNLKGPVDGNPFTEVDLSATFITEGVEITVNGFYDGNGVYKIRFMPNKTGIWKYTTHSNQPSLRSKTGRFECEKASDANHGPVRVQNTYHLSYEDGTPYYQIGTTCYAWTHQPQALQEQTLETLKNSPFNKIRMCIFPKDYDYNKNEPKLFVFERNERGENDYTRFNTEYFKNLETRITQLRELGIEADLILFHPYDRWGFANMDTETDIRYLKYVVARLGAFRNVWWSMANEFDLMENKTMADWDRLCKTVYENDPYKHMLGIHNCRGFYDHDKPWITHASIQSSDFKSAKKWREQYQKPLIYDECRYEGDIQHGWGRLTPEEMTGMFWKSLITGTYAGHGETYHREDEILWWSKGGVLHGQSPERIHFFKKYLIGAPTGGYEPINEYAAGKHGEHYLFYFGEEKPLEWSFDLPDYRKYQVEIIDTWNMTSEILRQNFQKKFTLKLPGKPYMAIKITCVGYLYPIAPIVINYDGGKFLKKATVALSQPDKAAIYYTMDGSLPDEKSSLYEKPVSISRNLVFKAIAVDKEGSKSAPVHIQFEEVSELLEPVNIEKKPENGLAYRCFEGFWDKMPETNILKPVGSGVANSINLESRCFEHGYCLEFNGFIEVPEDEVYTFYARSDDGSKLWIGDKLVVDNDGIHGEIEKLGQIALRKGFHPIRAKYFENKGDSSLRVFYRIAGSDKKKSLQEFCIIQNNKINKV
jgi:hypothetical protein